MDDAYVMTVLKKIRGHMTAYAQPFAQGQRVSYVCAPVPKIGPLLGLILALFVGGLLAALAWAGYVMVLPELGLMMSPIWYGGVWGLVWLGLVLVAGRSLRAQQWVQRMELDRKELRLFLRSGEQRCCPVEAVVRCHRRRQSDAGPDLRGRDFELTVRDSRKTSAYLLRSKDEAGLFAFLVFLDAAQKGIPTPRQDDGTLYRIYHSPDYAPLFQER